jgi:hypothetical protein
MYGSLLVSNSNVNANVAEVLGSLPASSDSVKYEGLQMNQSLKIHKLCLKK